MTTKDGAIEISPSNGYYFTNTKSDDFILRTTDTSQLIHMGGTSNAMSSLIIGSNYTAVTGRLAIGKSNPLHSLDVVGNINMTGNLMLNGSVLLNSNLSMSSNTINTFQVLPVNQTFKVTDSTQNTFALEGGGYYSTVPQNCTVYLNGTKLGYIDETKKDYDVTISYPSSYSTIYTITLTESARYNDVIDITIWPFTPNPFVGFMVSNLDFGNIFQTKDFLVKQDSNTSTLLTVENKFTGLEASAGINFVNDSNQVSRIYFQSSGRTTNRPHELTIINNMSNIGFSVPRGRIRFATGSSYYENMTLTEQGNLGLGTTNPLSALEISDSVFSRKPTLTLYSSNAANVPQIEFVRGSRTFGTDIYQDWRIYTSNGNMRFYTEGTDTGAVDGDIMVMNWQGNVGIGNVTPSNKLDIQGTTRNVGPQNSTLAIYSSTSNGTVGDMYIITGSNSGTGIGYDAKVIGVNIQNTLSNNLPVQRASGGGSVNAAAISLNADGGPGVSFFTGSPGIGSNVQRRMVITQAGNVGIGTTAPASALEVIGTVTATSATVKGSVHNSTTAGYAAYNANMTWDGTQWLQDSSTGGYGSFALVSSPNSNGGVNIITMGSNNAAGVRMAITASGRVGIGTTTPTSALEVDGTITGNSAIFGGNVTNSSSGGWASYFGNMYWDGTDHQQYVSNSGYGSFLLTTSAGSNGGLNILTMGSNNASGVRMSITASGRVGIATQTPRSELDVNGTITATAFSGPLTGAITTNNSNITIGNGGLIFGTDQAIPATGTNGGTGDKIIIVPGTTGVYPYSVGYATSNMWFSGGTGANFRWYTAGSNIMSLSNNGILTTGTINATTFTGALTGNASSATVAFNLTGNPSISTGTITTNNSNITVGTGTVSASSFVGTLTGNASSATEASNLTGNPNISTGTITTNNSNITIGNGGLIFGTDQAIPATGTNGGTGDKIIIVPGTTGVYPYSVGYATSNMWFSGGTGANFRWYTAGSNIMSLSNNGILTTGTINATTFTGALTGNASSATVASNLTGNPSISTGTITTNNSNITVGTGTVSASSFVGTLTGNASTATYAAGAGLASNLTAAPHVVVSSLHSASSTAIGSQGAFLHWNRSGGDGETWLINQKGTASGSGSIRFGSSTTASVVTELARIDSTGLGIGVAPSYKLDIQGPAPTFNMRSVSGDSNGPQIRLDASSAGGRIYNIISTLSSNSSGPNNFQIGDLTAGLPRMVIDQYGNIGMGVSAPTYKVDVQGSSNNQSAHVNVRAVAGDTAGPGFRMDATAAGGRAYTISSSLPSNGSGASNLQFSDNTANAVRMVIDKNGNVGINDVAPAYKLDVGGDINFTGTLYKNGVAFVAPGWTAGTSNVYTMCNLGVGTSTPEYNLDVSSNACFRVDTLHNTVINGSGDDSRIVWVRRSSGSNIAAIEMNGWGAGNQGSIRFYTASNTTAMTEKMIISEIGNVGIGTSSPAYKFDVNGDSIIRGWVRTTGTNGWYSETYGGGWRMTDTTWIRSFNSKSVYIDQALAVDGNVGIGMGTTAPSYNLDVSGDARVNNAVIGTYSGATHAVFAHSNEFNGTDYAILQNANGKTVVNSATGQLLCFRHGGVNDSMVLNAGDVGIGTSSPASKLHVVGNATITSNIYINGPGTNFIGPGPADNATLTAYNLKIRSWWGIGFPSYDDVNRIVMDTRTGNIIATTFTGALSGNATTATNAGGLTGTPSITVGTISSGAITTTGNTNFSIGFGPYWSGFSDYAFIRFQGTADATGSTFLEIATGDNGDEPIIFSQYVGTATKNERMRIHTNGFVGIGNTAPTYRLDVAGNTRLNNSLIGDCGHGTTYAAFGHPDKFNTTDYALLHQNNGSTVINSSNSTGIYFRHGNIDKMVLFNGKLGLGTLPANVPQYEIDVVGSVRASSQLISTVATGTAPFVVSSTTLVANLNADLLEGLNSTSFLRSDAANTANVRMAAAHGTGIRFWDNDAYKVYMSGATDATWGGRVNGETTSDYNMYFRMGGGTNRGFVFQNGTTSVAGIDASGNIRTTGNMVSSADIIGVGFLGGADTVTTPTFSWTADSNTGIYRPAADTLAITCGGVETIRSSLTQTKLGSGGEFSANAGYNFLYLDLNIDSTTLTATRTYRGIYNAVNSKALKGTYTPGMQGVYNEIVNSTLDYGDASCGTMFGVYNYVLNQSSNVATGSVVENMYGTYNWLRQLRLGTTSNTFGVYNRIRRDAGTLVNAYGVYNLVEGTVSGANYGIYSTGETDNYLSGNLGIGVTDPLAKLHVSGDARITGDAYVLGGALYPNTATTTATNFLVNVYGGTCTINGPLALSGYGISSVGNITVSNGNNIVVSSSSWAGGIQFRSHTTGAGTGDLHYIMRGGTTEFKNHLVIHSDSSLADSGVNFVTNSSVSRMYLRASDGNLGIGTTAPASKLHVVGTAGSTSVTVTGNISCQSIDTQNNNITLGTGDLVSTGDITCTSITTSGASNQLYFYDRSIAGRSFAWYSTGNTSYLWTKNTTNNTSGNLISIDSAGNVVALADITAFGTVSDKRLKTDINALSNNSCLSTVGHLRPVTFKWKDDIYNEEKRGTSDVGFIAQEVEEVIPLAVGEFRCVADGETYKKIKHERITPYLVGAIQELTQQNRDKDIRIQSLEYENVALRNEMNDIKALLSKLLQSSGTISENT